MTQPGILLTWKKHPGGFPEMMKFPCFFAVLEEFYFASLVLERNERCNYLLRIFIRKRRAKENIKKGDSRTRIKN
jgi:hypothetical protein